MGQQEVLNAIEELGFTTVEELRGMMEVSQAAINRSLTVLKRWNEILAVELGSGFVYLSLPFFEELKENLVYE